MRCYIIFLFLVQFFPGLIFAQERDTIVKAITAPVQSGVFPEDPGRQMSPGTAPMPMFFQDFRNGFDFQSPVFPDINFNLMNGWKTETGTVMGFRSILGYPLVNSMPGLYGRSVWDIYQGTYGIRTYQVNNRLFVGTAGYSDKNYNAYALKSGYLRQTNYNSSLFVGYKFSEKFSISACFTIQRNGDPLNRGIQNGGIFP